jgi:hypothetical protein
MRPFQQMYHCSVLNNLQTYQFAMNNTTKYHIHEKIIPQRKKKKLIINHTNAKHVKELLLTFRV